MKATPAGRPIECRAPVDGRELAHYQENPGNPAAEQRFALHVLSRDPGDVWAASTMALHESTDVGFEKKIRRAIASGLRAMTARAALGGSLILQEDPAGPATLMAMRLYANHLALRGRADEACDVLKTMLELDPDDTVDAISMLESKGVVVGPATGARMN